MTQEHPAAGRAYQGDPYAVFRPRFGRFVAAGCAIGCVVVFTTVALVVPGGDTAGWRVTDRVLLILLGLVVAFGLSRFAMIRAVPTTEGLTVRNLILTRHLEWSQVVRVQFSGGAPWLMLDLDDTDTLAVMAIQRSDGAYARAEAGRMSALAQVHGGTDPQDRPGPQNEDER